MRDFTDIGQRIQAIRHMNTSWLIPSRTLREALTRLLDDAEWMLERLEVPVPSPHEHLSADPASSAAPPPSAPDQSGQVAAESDSGSESAQNE